MHFHINKIRHFPIPIITEKRMLKSLSSRRMSRFTVFCNLAEGIDCLQSDSVFAILKRTAMIDRIFSSLERYPLVRYMFRKLNVGLLHPPQLNDCLAMNTVI